MQQVILLHNPSAGDEDHMKADLIRAIENEGYHCSYFSIKKDKQWKEQFEEADFAVVAGGDGTVRKVVKELVKRSPLRKRIALALLPMGTANNLSKTLSLDKDTSFEDHVKDWENNKRQRFDVGLLEYDGHTDFFLEGVGYGVFPALIQQMDSIDTSHLENAEEKIQLALEKLYKIIHTAGAQYYTIHADNETYEGKYLLLEVMNISSIGPNLMLAPSAQIDDGYLDLVAITEQQRDVFAMYIKKLIHQEDVSSDFQTIRAKKLRIQSDNQIIHIDDKLISTPHGTLTIEVREHLLDLLK